VTAVSKTEDVDALVEQFQKSGLRELHLRCEELEIYLSTDSTSTGIFRNASPQAAASANPASPPGTGSMQGQAEASVPPSPDESVLVPDRKWPVDAVLVRTPYLGTFYRAPKPGAPPYVEVGAEVVPETELCMVEVMKLFTALRAGIRGTVHAVLAEDGQLVQAEQPLFVLLASP
jgi:acetyl-CoA carboxylase biotin carboxyl carrier protein